MDWIRLRTEKPPLDTEVLVFQQGYDVTGTTYWAHIKIAEFVRPFNKKRPVFGINIQREKDGYVYGGFPLDSVTHWMPLPEPPRRRITWITKNPPPKRITFAVKPPSGKPKRVSFIARR